MKSKRIYVPISGQNLKKIKIISEREQKSMANIAANALDDGLKLIDNGKESVQKQDA